jgi:hypothetical protein
VNAPSPYEEGDQKHVIKRGVADTETLSFMVNGSAVSSIDGATQSFKVTNCVCVLGRTHCVEDHLQRFLLRMLHFRRELARGIVAQTENVDDQMNSETHRGGDCQRWLIGAKSIAENLMHSDVAVLPTAYVTSMLLITTPQQTVGQSHLY